MDFTKTFLVEKCYFTMGSYHFLGDNGILSKQGHDLIRVQQFDTLLKITGLLREARELQKKAEEELSKCRGRALNYHQVDGYSIIPISP